MHILFAACLLLTQRVLAQAVLPARAGFAKVHACSAVDLRGDFGPVRTQGDTALCFAYASALRGEGVVGPELAKLEARCRAPVADRFGQDFWSRMSAGMISNKQKNKMIAALDFALDHGRAASIGYDLKAIVDADDPGGGARLAENRGIFMNLFIYGRARL